MPVVNIGTAQNLFDALNESLSENGLDFSNCLSSMSDTTNVMKGAQFGVQKLIKNECTHVLDVGCFCHLADLAVKAGMQTLPFDIDKLFVDVIFFFLHNSKTKGNFVTSRIIFSSESQTILNHCTTRWLRLCVVLIAIYISLMA